MQIEQNNLDNIKVDVQTDLFGETHETLQLSMKDRIGFLPISVWKPDWGISTKYKNIIGDSGETRELVGKKMALMGSKYEVSIFNPHLAMMILSAYCPKDAYIFDPFGGGGTRGFIASAMGHRYFGIELRSEEVERIHKKQLELQNDFELVVGDSRNYQLAPETFDFCYTCPPYYDLEVYSDDEADLSAAASYDDFLMMMLQCLQTTYLALKPNSLSVWVVGNFRDKKGNLTHFNGDLIRLAKEVGFKLHDELIFWGASGAAHQRVGQFEANRKSVRVHEYIIILSK